MPRVKRHQARYRARKLKAVATGTKHEPFRKIIGRHTSIEGEYTLHATKGYRYQTTASD